MRRSYTPALRATYRVQLNARFTLGQARGIVPYLADLGISHLYVSPIMHARRGSMHGYDAVDPRRINPEIGAERDLVALADALHERGMGLLVDIVPNHMGIGPENPYWQDVLANGRQSGYARWFDIAWDMHPHGKLVVPSLADESAEPEEHAHHRVVHWKRGAREINYRRFFDVNDLVGLRMEDPEVFRQTHEYLLSLLEREVIDGLRVDHVDGLRRPAEYLRRLREETDRRRPGGVPILVEKILTGDERVRVSWPVDGTTGYERLNDIEDLFIDPAGFARLEERYRSRRRSKDLTFSGTVRADKRAVLDRSFAPEVARLSRLLAGIVGETSSAAQIYHGIEEFVAAMPVYRTYVHGTPADEDLDVLRSMPLVEGETIANRIRSLVCHPERGEGPSPVLEFIERLQQLTGPAMAKGLEDTAHYAYVPLVSRNEVGGSPERPLDDIARRFHDSNCWFAAHFPSSLVATSTHDTKRSGDVRARISALSAIDREWMRAVSRWRRLNRRHHQVVRGRIVPDPNAELLLYQTLVGAWPISAERVRRYMLKAVREAKLRTSWTEPDEGYEKSLLAFVDAILSGGPEDPFLSDLSALVARIEPAAIWNTRARILLHLTLPGTPDLYQGDETWSFTLVDPDNRWPVSYPPQSSEKLDLTRKILAARREHAALFIEGDYRPLVTGGSRGGNVIAFEHRLGDARAVVLAPRLVQDVEDWSGTWVAVDDPGELCCALAGRPAVIRDGRIEITATPFALLFQKG